MTKLDLVIGIYLIWGLILGMCKSDLTFDSLLCAKWLLLLCIYLVSRLIYNKNLLIVSIVLVGLVQSCIAIIQYIGIVSGNHIIFRVTGFMMNPGQLGGFQSVALVSGVSLFPKIQKLTSKATLLVYFVIIAIISYSLILSDSRAGIVAAFGGIVFIFRKQLKELVVHYKWLIILFALICCILLYSIIYYRPESIMSRLLIWKVSFCIFKDNIFTGLGPGQFNLHYMLYQAEYFASHPKSSFVMLADNVAYPYNEYLHIMTELGITGLVIFVILLITVFRNTISKEALAPLLTLLIFSFFSYPIYKLSLAILFPILIGASDCSKFIIKRSYRRDKIVTVICLAIFAPTVINQISICSRLKNYFEQQQIYDCLSSDIMKTYTNHKINMKYSYSLIDNYILIDDISFCKVFPMCEMWCEVGKIMENKGALTTAETYYRTAENMIPTRIKPSYLLWQLFLKQGRYDEAEKLGRKILSKQIKIENTFTLKVKQEIRARYEL